MFRTLPKFKIHRAAASHCELHHENPCTSHSLDARQHLPAQQQ